MIDAVQCIPRRKTRCFGLDFCLLADSVGTDGDLNAPPKRRKEHTE